MKSYDECLKGSYDGYSGKFLEELIINSLETGAIGHWAKIDYEYNARLLPKYRPGDLTLSESVFYYLINGQSVLFDDVEDEVDYPPLTLDRLLKGLKKAKKTSIDFEDIDDNGCDIIIQYALFGEIVFS